MKNLPEKDFWNEIKTRLENYTEEPDDDWNKIASAIPSPGNSHTAWSGHASGIVTMATLTLFLLLPHPAEINPAVSVEARIALGSSADIAASDTQYDRQPSIVPLENAGLDTQHKIIKGDPEKTSMSSSTQASYVQKDVPGIGDAPLTSSAPYANGQQPEAGEDQSINSEIKKSPSSPLDSLSSEKTKCDTTISTEKEIRKNDPKKKKKKFSPSVYFLATPFLAYQKIIPNHHDAVTIQKLNSSGIFSSDRIGISVEAGFQMQVTKVIELYTALSYYQQQQSVSYTYQSPNGLHVEGTSNSLSYTLSPGTATREFNYTMKNAGAAFGLLYHINGDKLMHKIGGGLQYQKGFAASENSYDNSASSYLNYQLLYRMEFVLSRKAHFFVQPAFVHAILSEESLNEPLKMKPYRAGFGFGVVYHFR